MFISPALEQEKQTTSGPDDRQADHSDPGNGQVESAATPAGVLDREDGINGQDRQRYIIPMRKGKGGELLPRSLSSGNDATASRRTISTSGSDSDTGSSTHPNRPRRRRKQPAWMTSPDWELPQTKQHTFTVPVDQVIWV